MGDHRFFGQINTCRDPIVGEAENRIINELRCHRPDLAIAESQALFNNVNIPIGERIAAAKDIERNTRGCADHLIVRPIQYNDGVYMTKGEQVSLVEKVPGPYGRLQDQFVAVANLTCEQYPITPRPGFNTGYYGRYGNQYNGYGGQFNRFGSQFGGYGGPGIFGTALGTGIGMYEQHREHKRHERHEREEQLLRQQQMLQQQQRYRYGY